MQLVDFSARDSISAVLIVKDEAAFISRALGSLLWCDEIVVVDSYSTDQTKEICLNSKAPWVSKIKFIQQNWLGFSDQRNFAINQANSQWIFFLDGDEACSPALSSRIQEILTKNKEVKAIQYKVHRQEYFLGKPIYFGIWNPSFHVRLFKKGNVKFSGAVHEGTISDCETLKINESIFHIEDLRIERFLNKLNTYTSLQAKDDFSSGMRTNFFKIFFAFPAMFYKNYFYYRSYRDGKEGFIISVLEGISRTVRHLKIWQLQRGNKP